MMDWCIAVQEQLIAKTATDDTWLNMVRARDATGNKDDGDWGNIDMGSCDK